MSYKSHPIASVFPMLSQRKYEELRDDIKQNGQMNPIYLYEGMILDGRNRAKACDELGISIGVEIYTGDKPIAFVISQNMKRRHLNESQRGVIGYKLTTMKHGVNKNTGPGKTGKSTSDPQICGSDVEILGIPDISQEDAAEITDVSVRTIQGVAKIDREAPEKIQDIIDGKKTINKVLKEITDVIKKEKEQKDEINKTPFSISDYDEVFSLFLFEITELCKEMKKADSKELFLKKAQECKKIINKCVKEICRENGNN